MRPLFLRDLIGVHTECTAIMKYNIKTDPRHKREGRPMLQWKEFTWIQNWNGEVHVDDNDRADQRSGQHDNRKAKAVGHTASSVIETGDKHAASQCTIRHLRHVY
jgi:hypothetical protein